MVLPQLRRVRWAVRATLVLGVAASVVANILHALDNPISQAIAAWPPLALLLTVELISRVPVHRRYLAVARLVATATIAGIAAWVSYWHMAGVAARYGETGASPYLLPLSVDGLIVVAGICLVELGGRISSLEAEAAATAHVGATIARATDRPAAQSGGVVTGQLGTGVEPSTVVPGEPAGPPAPAAGGEPTAVPGLIPTPATAGAPVNGSSAAPKLPPSAVAEIAGLLAGPARTPRGDRVMAAPASGTTPVGAAIPALTPTITRQPRTAGPTKASPAKTNTAGGARAGTAGRTAKKRRRTPAETVALAERIKADRPGITETALAAELGISVSRWRTVRRAAAESADHGLAA